MEHHKLVLPEYLNHHGALFGGHLLKWIDEVAFITANLDYPGQRFVTIGLDDVAFRHRITNGEILRFVVMRTKQGRTSVEYNIQVFGERDPKRRGVVLFETHITFVNIDASGEKLPLRVTKNS